LYTKSSIESIQSSKQSFKVKDLKFLNKISGLKMEKNLRINIIKIWLKKYIREILKFSMLNYSSLKLKFTCENKEMTKKQFGMHNVL
jgi:hypothetical protein